MKKTIDITRWALVLLLALLMTACSSLNGDKQSEGYLKERASLRWAAMIKKDWEGAYQYQLPAYRQTHTLDQYKAKFGNALNWKTIKVVSAVIDQKTETADVKLVLTFGLAMPGDTPMENSTDVNERWLMQDNEWWIAD